MTAELDDAGARRRIEEDLGTNLMVVAGAGTGKTSALVARIVSLVRSGTPLGEIAAITFTEAAAAELRERVRRAVERAADDGDDERLAPARDEVDDAAISTLHSFAQRLLLDRCVDAGLPPGFEVLDDTAEVADFAARWARFLDALFDEPSAERALTLGLAVGLRPGDLSAVAWNLHTHWDRLEDGGLEALAPSRRCDDRWPDTDPAPVLAALDRALEMVALCTDETDQMFRHLQANLAEARQALADRHAEPLALLQVLDALPPFRCAKGRQENWGRPVAEVRAACTDAERARGDLLDAVRRAVLGDLVARIARFTVDAAEQRRLEGRLTFHDLLVHARRLVRRGGECLEVLRRRYRRILIDEFQDTDPIQVELAARLAAAIDDAVGVGGARPGALFMVGDPQQSIYRFRRADIELFDRVGAELGSTEVLRTNFRSVPGIVDFVNTVFAAVFGDGTLPGQAPHRPLAADRPHPQAAAGTVGNGASSDPDPGGRREAGAAPPPAEQLAFDGLALGPDTVPGPARRGRSASARPTGGNGSGRVPQPAPAVVVPAPVPVVAIGGAIPANMPEVRRRATSDAVAAVDQIVRHRWLVEDTETGARRAARYGDIAVLIPARSVLAALEDSFEDAGVPYRLEGAALLWGAEEVRDVLAVLRAVDDPTDAVAVLGALRSPGLACGDDDLVGWRAAGGSWDPRGAAPAGLEDHAVATAMAVLARLHRQRWWSEPSAMVAAAYRELRVFELAVAHRRPRDHWQRLRWLEDQARLFDESPGGTLRAFLTWADLRAGGDGRVGGIGPPDPDDDAVRVMTIHGAKGLEFPVVVLAGLERDPADAPLPPAVLWGDGRVPEVRLGSFRSAGFEQAGLRDQQLDNLERHRLLYVGMTRARDHLVVCLHHKQRISATEASLGALVSGICAEHPQLWRALPGAPLPGPPAAPPTEGGGTEAVSDGAFPARPAVEARPLPPGWEDERARLLARLRRRPVTSATAIAEHGRVRDPDGSAGSGATAATASSDPGWPDPTPAGEDGGELGRRIGRAVHAVLAQVDLDHGAGSVPALQDAVHAQVLTHGVAPQSAEVETMVRRALDSAVVARAATRRHWREVFVAAPAGSAGVLEGFVDLLFEDDDGLVVVDYKTDRLPAGDPPTEPTASYRLQVAAYADALESSTGRPVVRCVVLYVGGTTPVEHTVEGDDLAAARAEARRVAEVLVAS